jgi:5-methylcytosine-specific restriction endonuclease McrA
MCPTSEEQIQFLVNLQRLLNELLFVASYKFALLLALADLSVENGDDSAATLSISTEAIAEKFVQYYWRQAVPYPAVAGARVLKQNTGRQAAILNKVMRSREQHGDSLTRLMKQRGSWSRLVRRVARVVEGMPLWKLQTVGSERLDFLYKNVHRGRTIELRSGVAFCFRKFHALIVDLVHGAWVRYIRQQNLSILGEATDLNSFFFGSERAVLSAARPTLMEIQHGQCFYCRAALSPASTHVDHFVPWARYPVDLGHNLVLADSRCNAQKSDRLPAYYHLATWVQRNVRHGDQIAEALEKCGVAAQLDVSKRITQWAYAQSEAAGGLTWLRGDEMVPLVEHWRLLLAS